MYDSEFAPIVEHFHNSFPGLEPQYLIRVPGRINLIGEHTDYNGFPVMPMAIDRVICAAPLATVPMNNPTKVTRHTWQSETLTDGQEYRLTIRIATAPWPAGIETDNPDRHAAVPESSVPAAPGLVGQGS